MFRFAKGRNEFVQGAIEGKQVLANNCKLEQEIISWLNERNR